MPLVDIYITSLFHVSMFPMLISRSFIAYNCNICLPLTFASRSLILVWYWSHLLKAASFYGIEAFHDHVGLVFRDGVYFILENCVEFFHYCFALARKIEILIKGPWPCRRLHLGAIHLDISMTASGLLVFFYYNCDSLSHNAIFYALVDYGGLVQ